MPTKTYSCDDFVNVKEHQDLAVGYFDFDIYAVRKSNYSNYPIHYHDFYKISKSDFNHFPDNFDHLKNNVCIIGDYLLCNDFKKVIIPIPLQVYGKSIPLQKKNLTVLIQMSDTTIAAGISPTAKAVNTPLWATSVKKKRNYMHSVKLLKVFHVEMTLCHSTKSLKFV